MLKARRVALPFYVSPVPEKEQEEELEEEELQKCTLETNKHNINTNSNAEKVYVTTIYIQCVCFGTSVFWFHISEQPEIDLLHNNNDKNNVKEEERTEKRTTTIITPSLGCAAYSITTHLLTEQYNKVASKLLIPCSCFSSYCTDSHSFRNNNGNKMSEDNTQDDFALRLSQQLLRRANKLLKTKKENENDNVSEVHENKESEDGNNKSLTVEQIELNEVKSVIVNCALNANRAELLLGDACGNGSNVEVLQFSKHIMHGCWQLLLAFIN